MISSYMHMQNAILSRNIATSQMVDAQTKMLSALSFGNSQPLRPQAMDAFELQNVANSTKVSVLNKLIEAYEKALGSRIKRSAPKYAGVNYKA